MLLLSPSVNVLPSPDHEGAETPSVGSQVGLLVLTMLADYVPRHDTSPSPGQLLSD